MDYASLKARAKECWKELEEFPEPLVQIGMGTCGKAAGAERVLATIEQTLKGINPLGRIMHVGCIGLCYLEPLMAIRKGGEPFIYYGNLTPEKTEKILSDYLLHDDPIPKWAVCTLGNGHAQGNGAIDGVPQFHELPMIRPQVRIALRNCGLIDPENIDHYIARGGYSGLQKALNMEPDAVIQEIKASGLRGRGGAGFPTGMKWEFARKAPGSIKYVVCNADEGDPGAFMDRSLLESDPHAVLEGMLICAYAIGAREGYVYARAEYPLAIRRLRVAMKQMEENGLLGKHVMGAISHSTSRSRKVRELSSAARRPL
jgi:(2Fe-2S) ferredoxin